MLPFVEATAVGEERQAATAQAFQLIGIQSAAAAGGQPELLGIARSEDKCCLLALHDANVGIRVFRKQLLTEEALTQHIAFWQAASHLPLAYQVMYPTVVAVAVASGVVGHDVAGAYALLFVYLPEDDVAVVSNADVVVFIHAIHGGCIEPELSGAADCKPRPEDALRGMVLQHQRHGKRLHGRRRWRCGHEQSGLERPLALRKPRMVTEVVRGCVVVTAGLLVVAAADAVAEVAAVVVGIDVADQALGASALRAGSLLLAMSRQSRVFELVSIY